MASMFFPTINVEEIKEIKPHVERNRPFTLDVKVEMTLPQLAELILSALEDYGDEYLNEELKKHDLIVTYTGN